MKQFSEFCQQIEMDRQTNGWTDKTDGHADIAYPFWHTCLG